MKGLIKKIEKLLPMSFTGLLLFVFVLYLLFVVGKTVFENYKSNQDILVEQTKLNNLRQEVASLRDQNNYFETQSFKEKEAREKLGYIAPGEKVVSLPYDTKEEKAADSQLAETQLKVPNYRLWMDYFFGSH
jgi:cell division protein FtsB